MGRDTAPTKTGSCSSENDKNASTTTPCVIDWVLHNYDAETTDSPDVDSEIDQEPEECYTRLAYITARMFEAPIAIINLVHRFLRLRQPVLLVA